MAIHHTPIKRLSRIVPLMFVLGTVAWMGGNGYLLQAQDGGTATRTRLEAETRLERLKNDTQINVYEADEPGTAATPRALVGKLVGIELTEGELIILVQDKREAVVYVNEDTRVMLDGEPAALRNLREGDILRAVVATEAARFAQRIYAASPVAKGPVRDSNTGTVRSYRTKAPPRDAARERLPVDSGAALGITLYDNPDQGVLVLEVLRGSPADYAGLMLGDYITVFDGKTIETPDQLISLIGTHAPNEIVDIDIWRERKSEKLAARLASTKVTRDQVVHQGQLELVTFSNRVPPAGAVPRGGSAPTGSATAPPPAGGVPNLGMETALVPGQGMRVVNVVPGGPAALAGIVAGDFLTGIGDQAITTPAEFQQAMKGISGNEPLSVRVRRDQAERAFQLRLNAGGQPGVNQRGTNQRGVNQRGVNQRGVNQRGVNQRGVNQRGVNQRGVNQPGVNQRGVNQQRLNQQRLNQQRLNQQRTFQPGANQPAGTQQPAPQRNKTPAGNTGGAAGLPR